MTKVLIFMILAIILVAAGVAGQTVKTDVDPSRDFSKFARYAWQENHIVARQTPEVIARIEGSLKNAIDRELAKKGYELDPQKPDFFIHVEAGSGYETSVSGNKDFRLPTGTTVYTSQNPNGPGVDVWLTVVSQFHVITTDPSSGATIWNSVTTKKYKDPDKAVRNLDNEIGQIVGKALKSFPSRKKTG